MAKAISNPYGKADRALLDKIEADRPCEEFANKSMSWGELAEAQSYFEKLGKRYGLLAEFKENGLC